jgi:hypothetical protein
MGDKAKPTGDTMEAAAGVSRASTSRLPRMARISSPNSSMARQKRSPISSRSLWLVSKWEGVSEDGGVRGPEKLERVL